jgi:hypothetical protein
MPPPVPATRSDDDLCDLTETILPALARQFPVCMSSDEFHFFPQAHVTGIDWTRWDDFSAPALEDTIERLTLWENRLASVYGRVDAAPARPSDKVMDAAMLLRVIRTLHSQFARVRPHRRQPSFYLTIAGIGLAEAFEAGPQAFGARLKHLPAFLDQATANLDEVPRLFRDIGLEMLARQWDWLGGLPLPDGCRHSIQHAYQELTRHLERLAVQEPFWPPVDLYAEIARDHMGSGLSLRQIADELEAELTETKALLAHWAEDIAPGRPWQVVVADLPRTPIPESDPGRPYQEMIAQLATHCVSIGLATPDLAAQSPVRVETIPDYMEPVRSSAAYSMPPAYPPKGGTFFIQRARRDDLSPPDYRLLTAHETYPGHHLLDTSRWGHPRAVRRQIEFPIFYEGWASFCEELLFDTGFFGGPVDALLMAKRRFWRALRGQTDYDIHTRRKSLDEAAAALSAEGLPPKAAQAMVRRYSLKPGYQLAYTLGRRRFRRLYATWRDRSGDPVAFARRVLALGEIDFQHLERRLLKGG